MKNQKSYDEPVINNQFIPPYINPWNYAGKQLPGDRIIYYEDGLESVKNDDSYYSGSKNGLDFKDNQNTQFSDDSGSKTQKTDNILVGYQILKKILSMLQEYTSLSLKWIMDRVNKQMEQVALNQGVKID